MVVEAVKKGTGLSVPKSPKAGGGSRVTSRTMQHPKSPSSCGLTPSTPGLSPTQQNLLNSKKAVKKIRLSTGPTVKKKTPEPVTPRTEKHRVLRKKVEGIVNKKASQEGRALQPKPKKRNSGGKSIETAKAVFRVKSDAKPAKLKVAFDTEASKQKTATEKPKQRLIEKCFVQEAKIPLRADINGYIVILHMDDVVPQYKCLRHFAKSANIILATEEDQLFAEESIARHGVHGIVYNMFTWFTEMDVDGKTAYQKHPLLTRLEAAGKLGKVLIIETAMNAAKGYRQNTLLIDSCNSAHDHLILDTLHTLVTDLVESNSTVPEFLQKHKTIALEPRDLVSGRYDKHPTPITVAVIRPTPPQVKYNRSGSWWKLTTHTSAPLVLTPTTPSLGEQALPLVDAIPLPDY
eukprot:TRINITY_DN34233_c0_g1_i1.p1 TRINITY_DN34233_c0_g1~~TRINITY_DN34233_c0_g1_i1.p1  ORF type:complete len:405 (+),score=88.67 TRINITY_DN34233_c0_g1_i1:98-1312(+)